MKQIIFLSIILSCLLYLTNGEVLSDECDDVSIKPRIIGGEDAEIKDHPYVVSLRFRGNYFCTACSYTDRDVLTAAHCFNKNQDLTWPYEEVTIHTSTASSQELGRIYQIEKVTAHPGFTGTWETSMNHDILHIRVKNKMEIDENHNPADLPSENIVNYLKGIVTGWGMTKKNVEVSSERLQKLEMNIIDYTLCEGYTYQIYPEQLCAYKRKRHGCAKGDSGAPLVRNRQITGIHSWTIDGKSATGQPEIFSNVFLEKDFIELAMKGADESKPLPSSSSSSSSGSSPELDFKGKKPRINSAKSKKGRSWFRKITCTAVNIHD